MTEHWGELSPDAAFMAALERADKRWDKKAKCFVEATRQSALEGATSLRTSWSNRFADACAHLIADQLRTSGGFAGREILPETDGPSEPKRVFGSTEKKLDVVIASPLVGLEASISLKGMNFRDRSSSSLNFDKNLTGRVYEMESEFRAVRSVLPQAYMGGLFFLPVAACVDKNDGDSSFARSVAKLRRLTGRTDVYAASEWHRPDFAAVVLYSCADHELFKYGSSKTKLFDREEVIERGVVRVFDVAAAPPQRGRPRLASTQSIEEWVDGIPGRFAAFAGTTAIEWSDPEPEEPGYP